MKSIPIRSSLVLGCVILTSLARAESPRDASEFPRTEVVPVLSFPVHEDKNQIYCDTMAHAWNALGQMKTFERALPLTLQGGESWSDALNAVERTLWIDDSPDRFAMAGMKKEGIVERINAGLAKKFGGKAPSVEVSLTRPDDILAYAYLRKSLEFAQPFEDTDLTFYDRAKYDRVELKSFGIGLHRKGAGKGQEGMASQIRIYDDSYEHTVLEIRPKGSEQTGDTILLLKVYDPGKSLGEMVDGALAKVKGKGAPFVYDSGLRVPVVDLNLRKHYREMQKPIVRTDYRISEAIHDIKFALNKEGALLESSGTIMVTRGGGGPRNYEFAPPFVVILAQKTGKELKAYFAAWIANEELLQVLPDR
jgi:hypothetical protein